MRTAVFTIVAPNYRHFARVLMHSLREHEPEWDRFVLIVGDARSEGDEPFALIGIDELPLPHRRRFLFRYDVLELSTAVKPWTFAHLFARGYDRVVYLDPDISVYSPLVELDALPRETLLTLTPHLTKPAGEPRERLILLAGAWNLGFLAVARHRQLDAFLDWWKARLEEHCVSDPANGLFVDQKWMDLAPGLFDDVAILRHEGYNVAYWNLGQRTLGAPPLRFFHFSGFNPSLPKVLSKHDWSLDLATVPGAAELFDDYARRLREAGFESFRNAPYPFATFDDGTRIPNAARVAYRTSPELQAECGEDPFAHAELFREMHDPKQRLMSHASAVRTYRVLSAVRPVVELFPRRIRRTMRELLLGADPKPLTRATRSQATGLTITGYVTRNTGVGESARLCANACEAAGLPHRVIDVDDPPPQAEVFGATIHHVNADQVALVRQRLASVFDASACNIGCWHWELPELPDAFVTAAEPFDELWAPSKFIQATLAAKLRVPVVHMPHGVAVTHVDACSPAELGVPAGRFVFLCMFDFDSIVERKNPLAAIEAFRLAFPNESSAALLVKTTNGDRHPEELAALRERLQTVRGAYLADRALSRSRVNGLIAACDAVVSLHRSEGFGLILAEAMDLGKPVIATGWSGNMDFMTPLNSCPIDFRLVTIEKPYGPYAAGQQWADPDVDHAARSMRRIVEHAAYREQLGLRAQETMRTDFSPRAAGLRYEERLKILGLR